MTKIQEIQQFIDKSNMFGNWSFNPNFPNTIEIEVQEYFGIATILVTLDNDGEIFFMLRYPDGITNIKLPFTCYKVEDIPQTLLHSLIAETLPKETVNLPDANWQKMSRTINMTS